MKRSHEMDPTSSSGKNRKVRKSIYQVMIILDETIGSKLLYHKFKYQTTELQLFLQHVPVLYWYPIDVIGTANFKYDIDSCVFSAAVRNPLHQYSTKHLIKRMLNEQIESKEKNLIKCIQKFIKTTLRSQKRRIKKSNSAMIKKDESLEKSKLYVLLKNLLHDELFIKHVSRESDELSIMSETIDQQTLHHYCQIYNSWSGQFKLENSENMKDNEEIVLQVVKVFDDAIKYASNRLKNDEEFILKVVKYSGRLLKFASNRLKDNEMIVLEAVKQNGDSLYYASDRLQNNEMIVLQATRTSANSIRYASDRLKDDELFILEAVKQNGHVLCYASDRFKDNEEIVREAIRQNGMALEYVSERLKDNEEIVLEAMKQDGEALYVAPDRFKDNELLILEALKHNACAIALMYAKRLSNDFNFAKEIFKCCNSLNVFEYFGKELRNIEFIHYFIENYQSRFHELVRKPYHYSNFDLYNKLV